MSRGAPTRSEAGRRTREAERGTIQSSLAPPQRPPPNLSPPTFRAARQPPPKSPWSSSRNRTQKLSGSLVGDHFHVLHVRPSQLPRLGSVPCHSRCPCPQSPRQEGGGPKGLESWENPMKGRSCGAPSPPFLGNHEHTPNSTRARQERAGYWPLGVRPERSGSHSLHPSPPHPQLGARL